MKLFLVRHGTTEWMEVNRLHGSMDSPLSERGQYQAKQAGLALKDSGMKRIFCSPQGRARQTAGFIAEYIGLEPEARDWLHEMSFGVFEGSSSGPYRLPVRFIRHNLIKLLHAFDIPRYGESWKHIRARISRGWQELVDERLEGPLVLVSHTLTLETLIKYLLRRYEVSGLAGNDFFLSPASISELDVNEQDGTVHFIRVNDISHYEKPAT